MGGDTFKDDEESSRSSSSSPCSCCFSDDLGFKDDVSEENFTNFSNHVTDLRRREKAYQEILQSHDLLLRTSKRKLRQARNEILRYFLYIFKFNSFREKLCLFYLVIIQTQLCF
jgi:hypothetical protein